MYQWGWQKMAVAWTGLLCVALVLALLIGYSARGMITNDRLRIEKDKSVKVACIQQGNIVVQDSCVKVK